MATEKLKFKIEFYATMWDKPPHAEVLINDIKTLEKAVYQKSDITSGTTIKSNSLNEDILTKHL